VRGREIAVRNLDFFLSAEENYRRADKPGMELSASFTKAALAAVCGGCPRQAWVEWKQLDSPRAVLVRPKGT
jgi:hypothetical protein